MEQGIAGGVATSGILANIPDAYDNPQFNQVLSLLPFKHIIQLLLFFRIKKYLIIKILLF
jgi:hypothetical protein